MSIATQMRNIIERKKNALRTVGIMLEREAKENVAVKTGELEESIRFSGVTETLTTLKATVVSEAFYSKYVEYGVQNKEYLYRRNGTVIFRGVGLHYLNKTLEQNRETIINIIRNA